MMTPNTHRLPSLHGQKLTLIIIQLKGTMNLRERRSSYACAKKGGRGEEKGTIVLVERKTNGEKGA